MKIKKSKTKKEDKSIVLPAHSKKWLSFLVFSVAFFTGINTLNHDFTLDDEIYYSGNKYVQKGFSGIADVFTHGSTSGFKETGKKELYRPVVSLSFILEKELFHNNPHASHFIQVLLYAFACLLLLKFLKTVFNDWNSYIPILITVLFAVHPLHTEVVSSIKSRDEILAFIFSICSLIQIIQFARTGERKKLFLSCLYLLLALLSKESAVYLLAIIPLTIYFFSSANFKQAGYVTLFSIIIFAGYFLLRNSVVPFDSIHSRPDLINNSLMGAENGFQEYGTAIVIIGFYILRLFIPYPLSYDYSYNQIPLVNEFSWQLILTIIIVAGMIIYAIVFFKKKDFLAYGFLFFLISLFPASNLLLKIDATAGFRFNFTPILGFCIVITGLVLKLIKVNFSSVWSSSEIKKVRLIFIPVLFLFFILSAMRNSDWKNNYALFSHDVEISPSSTRIQSSLAFELSKIAMSSGNVQAKMYYLEQAKNHYRESVKIYPRHPDAWYNLGMVYFNLGNTDSAKVCLYKANEVNPFIKNPLKELGGIYYNSKQNDSALFYFKKVHLIDSTDSDANSIISFLENQK